MAAKKTRMGKVMAAVKSAAKTTVTAADEYVVEPVGKALGLIKKKKPAAKKKPARKKTVAGAAKPKKAKRK